VKQALTGFGASEWLAPAQARRFQPLRVIGTGGMGTVVLARDRVLGRLVALKFLRETCALFLERFRREARLMASLRHPAIVPLVSLEESGPRPFLVLEYVRGGNLAQARLDPLDLARALRGIVAALAHAHAHGIVHRDVKPENVLLDGRGRAFLTDFGLALEGREGLTRPAVAGTLQVMSPEQVRGAALGPATDQFSLGATLYRSLTGEWPHRGRTVADVMEAIEHEPPLPPRLLAPGVPAELERLVLRALAKDPARRFASMVALGRALERALAGRPLARAFARLRSLRRGAQGRARERAVHPPSLMNLPPLHQPLP
jgi:serine/threonine protein kinase